MFCHPGERLCSLEEGTPGSGTYARHGSIFASLAGCLMKKSENGKVRMKQALGSDENCMYRTSSFMKKGTGGEEPSHCLKTI